VIKGWTAVLVLAVSAGAALASGYDDFSRGITANQRGETDAAIRAFTAALAAPDLVKAYIPAAHRGLAYAYLQKKECGKAKDEIDAYTALRSLSHDILGLRAAVDLCLKDVAAAQRDFDASMFAESSWGGQYAFARELWRLGYFAEAAANLAAAIARTNAKDPMRPYLLLWYALDAQRAGTLDTAKLAKLSGDDDWPYPLLQLFLGKQTPAQVMGGLSKRDSDEARGRRCEANFYIGEWLLGRGKPDEAKPLIAAAAEQCPHDFIERKAAEEERDRPGATPAAPQPPHPLALE
jgi:hypothetical protein